MRKTIFALLLMPFLSFGQNDSNFPKIEGDSLVLESGFKVASGQMLKIGVGSTPDGDFKYIRVSATSMFHSYSTTGYNGLANAANALPRSSSGLEYKVVRIDKRGTKKNGYVYYPIINVGMTRFEVDIVNAIAAGELAVPEKYNAKKEAPATTVVVKQEVSVADELAKLKKLMDDGVITKEEFEAQKKKLLDKQ